MRVRELSRLFAWSRERHAVRKNGYLLCGLLLVELLMSFSFLGYIHIEPISMTFLYIPVLLAGCLLGAAESTLVGAVFGLAAMWKASAHYVGSGDALFSPLMSGKPLESILLSVGARAAFGLLIGLAYGTVRKTRHPLLGMVIVTGMGKTLHSALVYGLMGALFPEAGFGMADVLAELTAPSFVPMFLIQNALVLPCHRLWHARSTQAFFERIRMVDRMQVALSRGRRTTWLLMLLALIASFNVAWYFINRLESVMEQCGLKMTASTASDIRHLQIQFLLGVVSLFLLAILLIVLYQKDSSYRYYEARLDGLTGLLHREQFFLESRRWIQRMPFDGEQAMGCFIVLDIDEFKQVNDRHGHPEGDRVLRDVAARLKSIMGDRSILGRLGGDEFVALVEGPMEDAQISALLSGVKAALDGIRIGEKRITCSMGAIPIRRICTVEDLYLEADRLLYEAKKQGKDQFVVM